MNDMNLENLKKTFVYFIKTKNKFKRNANMEQTSMTSTAFCIPEQFIPANNRRLWRWRWRYVKDKCLGQN